MSLDLIAWPDALPKPQLKTHALPPQSRVISSPNDNGFVRLRHRRIKPPRDMPVSWLLTSAKLELFEGWFEHVINHGAREFSFPVLVGDQLHPLPCKFKPAKNPYKSKPEGGGYWRVTANFLVRNVPVISADETLQRIHGVSAQQVVDAADNAVTDYTTE